MSKHIALHLTWGWQKSTQYFQLLWLIQPVTETILRSHKVIHLCEVWCYHGAVCYCPLFLRTRELHGLSVIVTNNKRLLQATLALSGRLDNFVVRCVRFPSMYLQPANLQETRFQSVPKYWLAKQSNDQGSRHQTHDCLNLPPKRRKPHVQRHDVTSQKTNSCKIRLILATFHDIF